MNEKAFIGKKDINNKDICEGDILRYDEKYYIVKYIKRTASYRFFDCFSYDGQSFSLGRSKKFRQYDKYEVLGNMYKNKELLYGLCKYLEK
jgi:hypothetical protein